MIAVVQRVSSARVAVEGRTIAETGRGFAVLVGVARGDGEEEAGILARKVAGLRVFDDSRGRFDRDILHPEVKGEVLAVSQFTLLADCTRGRRPGFEAAERPERAEPLFDSFVEALRRLGVPVETGRFGAKMTLFLVNEGPVTILLDTALLSRRR